MPIFLITTAHAIADAQQGVVPVIAQAGTAFLPLLALAVTNTLGLLLKPKELVRTLKAKPWILLILALIGVGGWWFWGWVTADPVVAAKAGKGSQAPVTVAGAYQADWSKVALEILRQEEAAHLRGAAEPPGASADSIAKPPTTPVAAVPTHGDSTIAQARYFRGGPERNGHLGGPALRGLVPLWSYYPQDDRNIMILSSPMVRDGKVYAASCLLDSPASFGTVFRLDLATGKQDWICEFKDPKAKQEFLGFFSSPAVNSEGTRLLIGQGLHMDFDAALVCLDTADGTVKWTVPTPLHIEGSPAIEGDIVVAGAGAVELGEDHKPKGDPKGKGHPGFVVGVRISTGEVLFRETVHDPEGSPVLKDGICYIGSGLNGSKVVAIRADLNVAELVAKGLKRRVWELETPYPATGAVTLTGDLLLLGCGKGDFVFAAKEPEGLLLAIDVKSGQKRWEVKLPDAVLAPIAVNGTVGIVPCRNGEVVAINLAQQGTELWRARLNKNAPVLAGAAFTGDTVYAVSNDGYLVVLDAKDGKQIERIYLNAKGKPGELGLCTSSPLLVDGKLVVGSETGGLRCFVGK